MDGRLLVEIKKWTNGKTSKLTDIVVLERTLTIYVNKIRLVSLAYLPEYSIELAFGFLLSEGIIDHIGQVKKFAFNEYEAQFEITIHKNRIEHFLQSGEKTSGCGAALSGSLESAALQNSKQFSAETILYLMQKFIKQKGLFKETGGVHNSALAKEDIISFQADDIGRHNAVDKVIGMAIIAKQTTADYILLTSGRISSEIVKKAVRAKIPLLVSHSAPTSEAIRIGWKYGVIIIGFTRGNRCTAYTFFDSIY